MKNSKLKPLTPYLEYASRSFESVLVFKPFVINGEF